MYWRVMPEPEYLEEVTDYQFRDLKGDVIDIGACVLCGACLLSCPEKIIKIEDRKPEIRGECPPTCNACYLACPRTYVPDNIINHETANEPLGDYIKIVSAKAPMFKGQDGGVVTALLSYALSEGIIDEVLVVDKDTENPWKPIPKLTKQVEDVVKAAGTKYSACPIFKAMGGS
jgi:Coenzyme F420-reducing hydrogenase, beta subunit